MLCTYPAPWGSPRACKQSSVVLNAFFFFSIPWSSVQLLSHANGGWPRRPVQRRMAQLHSSVPSPLAGPKGMVGPRPEGGSGEFRVRNGAWNLVLGCLVHWNALACLTRSLVMRTAFLASAGNGNHRYISWLPARGIVSGSQVESMACEMRLGQGEIRPCLHAGKLQDISVGQR